MAIGGLRAVTESGLQAIRAKSLPRPLTVFVIHPGVSRGITVR